MKGRWRRGLGRRLTDGSEPDAEDEAADDGEETQTITTSAADKPLAVAAPVTAEAGKAAVPAAVTVTVTETVAS